MREGRKSALGLGIWRFLPPVPSFLLLLLLFLFLCLLDLSSPTFHNPNLTLYIGQKGPTEEGEDRPPLSSSNVQSALAQKRTKFLFPPPCLSFNSYLFGCHSPVSCLGLGDRIDREGAQGHDFSPWPQALGQ